MAEDNTTVNNSGASYSTEFPVIELYVALPLRLLILVVVVFFTSVVLLTIKKSRFKKQTLQYFFVSNLMISDMAGAVITNLSAAILILISIVNHDSEGVQCTTIRASGFPNIASFGMLAALVFDRMIVSIYPTRYRQIVTKRRAYVVVVLIWLGSLLVSFFAFADPTLKVKTRTAVCSNDYYNYIIFGITLIPIAVSVICVVVQNVYNFSLALDHIRSLREYGTTTNEERNVDNMAELRAALSLFWDTQRPSIAVLLLVATNVLFHVIILPILVVVAKLFPDSALAALIWSIFVNITISAANWCHSFLYSWFLDSFSVVFGWHRCHIPILSCVAFSGTSNQLNRLGTRWDFTNALMVFTNTYMELCNCSALTLQCVQTQQYIYKYIHRIM